MAKGVLKITRKYGEHPILGANSTFFAFCENQNLTGLKGKAIDLLI
jgi:hypothetical protein